MGIADVKLNIKLIQILSTLNISEFTEIQKTTFPAASNGHDVIGVSQTGSGKTLAFLLPMLQQILLSDKPFHCLVLAPTRELAQQIASTLNPFESLSIRTALLSGGEDFNSQVNQINKKPHIIIGTPGTVVKHIQKTKNFKIERIRKLVFDEADRFFDQDFTQELDILAKKLIKKNQTLMFTATLSERCKKLASLFMRSPKIYGKSDEKEPIETLNECFILVPDKYKTVTLYNFLNEKKNQSIIVFASLCSSAQKLGMALSKLGLSCQYLHGKMSQIKRNDILNSFRNKEFPILISTDVAGRGLDIPHVEIVINYDLPSCSKDYTHRIGRTARAGKQGLAVSFVTQYDLELFQRIEHGLNRKIKDMTYKSYSNYDKVKEVVDEANSEFNLDKSFRK